MEGAIRLGSALAIFTAMALWEWRRPRLTLAQGRSNRWPANLGITVMDLALVRLTVGAAAVGAAFFLAHPGILGTVTVATRRSELSREWRGRALPSVRGQARSCSRGVIARRGWG